MKIDLITSLQPLIYFYPTKQIKSSFHLVKFNKSINKFGAQFSSYGFTLNFLFDLDYKIKQSKMGVKTNINKPKMILCKKKSKLKITVYF